jgi:hypothetical protein
MEILISHLKGAKIKMITVCTLAYQSENWDFNFLVRILTLTVPGVEFAATKSIPEVSSR